MSSISDIFAREILDSRGTPTLEVGGIIELIIRAVEAAGHEPGSDVSGRVRPPVTGGPDGT